MESAPQGRACRTRGAPARLTESPSPPDRSLQGGMALLRGRSSCMVSSRRTSQQRRPRRPLLKVKRVTACNDWQPSESCACEIVELTASDAIVMDSGTTASSFRMPAAPSVRPAPSECRRARPGRRRGVFGRLIELDWPRRPAAWPARRSRPCLQPAMPGSGRPGEPVTHRPGERIDCLAGLALNPTGRSARRLTRKVRDLTVIAPQPSAPEPPLRYLQQSRSS